MRTALKQRKQRSGLETGGGQDQRAISEKPVIRDATERKLISSKELDWTPQGGSHQHTRLAQLAHLTHAPHVSVPPSLELHETKG